MYKYYILLRREDGEDIYVEVSEDVARSVVAEWDKYKCGLNHHHDKLFEIAKVEAMHGEQHGNELVLLEKEMCLRIEYVRDKRPTLTVTFRIDDREDAEAVAMDIFRTIITDDKAWEIIKDEVNEILFKDEVTFDFREALDAGVDFKFKA